MSDFKVVLDGKEYNVRSTQSNKDSNDWSISTKYGNITSSINFPIEQNATRAKVMLFIEAFHVAMKNAFEAQGIDQNYVWNKN